MLHKRSTREIVLGKAGKAADAGNPPQVTGIRKSRHTKDLSPRPDPAAGNGETPHERIDWPPWAIATIAAATMVFVICMGILAANAYRDYKTRPPEILEGQAIISVSSDAAISGQISTGDVVRLYGNDGKTVEELQYVQVYSVEQNVLLLILDETQTDALLKLGNRATEIALLVHSDSERAAELVALQQRINNPEISLSIPAQVTIAKGEHQEMNCETSIQPTEAKLPQVQWETSDPSVVTVRSGTITGIGAGQAVVSAKCGSASAVCTVTVEVPLNEIQLDCSDAVMALGDTLCLTAIAVPEDATDFHVIWSSQNPEIANVSDDGVVTAVSVGYATITATCGNVSASCTVRVGVHAEMVQVDQISILLYVGQTDRVRSRTSPGADVIDSPTYTSSNPEVVTVSEDGTISAIAPGSATVTVYYGEASASCIVTVTDPYTPTPPTTTTEPT